MGLLDFHSTNLGLAPRPNLSILQLAYWCQYLAIKSVNKSLFVKIITNIVKNVFWFISSLLLKIQMKYTQ
jgi:hypothetical protein